MSEQIKRMWNLDISRLRTAPAGAKKSQPETNTAPNQLEILNSSMLLPNWHYLVLGATGAGKTTLVRGLVRSTSSRLIWVGGAHADLTALGQVLARQERFDENVLVVVDDVHLHAEQLELIEQVARDGLKSNVQLLITAQLLSDLPQAVWRNCQVSFALGEAALEQLDWTIGPLPEFQAAYKMPGRDGVVQIPAPEQFPISAVEETGNPFLKRASTPQLAPYEESAPAHQTPSDLWSEEGPAEPQGLRDHPHDSKGLPHRTRYSRTL